MCTPFILDQELTDNSEAIYARPMKIFKTPDSVKVNVGELAEYVNGKFLDDFINEFQVSNVN